MEKALGGDLGMLKPPYTVWIAAAFFGLPVALSSAWMSSHFHASREASHVEKETAPKNAGNSSRPILVEIFSSDEDKARVEQHEREKANTDLDLAEATWAIAKVTGFLAIFTLAVAGFTYKLWLQTRDVADKASKDSARHIETLANIERAYVVGAAILSQYSANHIFVWTWLTMGRPQRS